METESGHNPEINLTIVGIPPREDLCWKTLLSYFNNIPTHIWSPCVNTWLYRCIKQRILWKLNIYISLYLSNRPPGSPSILIIGWWCSSPEAKAWGALGSIPKAMCDTLLSPPHQFSTSLSPSHPYLPPLLRPFRLLSRCPHPFHIRSVLLPPPLGYPWIRYPLCRQIKIHNGPVCYELCNPFMVAWEVGIHLLHYCFFHHVLQWLVCPQYVPPSPRLPSCQPAGHPVVESA